MNEQNTQEQNISYHRSQKWANYLGAFLSVPGIAVGVGLVVSTSNQQIFYGDYNATPLIGLAGLLTMISSSVGLAKSIQDASSHGQKVRELEKI